MSENELLRRVAVPKGVHHLSQNGNNNSYLVRIISQLKLETALPGQKVREMYSAAISGRKIRKI